jgi:tetratricopeptide (TPR) repeat protein
VADLEAARARLDARLATNPDRPLDLEALGRIERELGLGGWEQRLRRAAEVLESWPHATDETRLQAAYLRWVAGDPDAAQRLRAMADHVLDELGAEEAPGLHEGSLLVIVWFLLGDDQRAAAMADRLAPRELGPLVEAVAATARARAAGDRTAADAALQHLERLAHLEPVDSTAMTPAARDLVRHLRRPPTGG